MQAVQLQFYPLIITSEASWSERAKLRDERLVTLYRPVGQKELDLIRDSRLPRVPAPVIAPADLLSVMTSSA